MKEIDYKVLKMFSISGGMEYRHLFDLMDEKNMDIYQSVIVLERDGYLRGELDMAEFEITEDGEGILE